MSKAWYCCNYEENIIEVVFADTRGKAKSYFKDLETFDYYTYCELRPFRAGRLDHLDYPDGYIMDWSKDEDRIAMVRELGLYCSDVDKESCETCCAKEWCDKYKEENNGKEDA